MDARRLLPGLIQAAGSGPHAVLGAVAPALKDLGFVSRATSSGDAVLWSRGQPRLAFSGHVDVVPIGDGWTRDPFGGEVSEDRIWGRGACDMLGAVAAFVGAASRSRDAPCAILLTTDEETRMHAAEHAITQGLLTGIQGVVVGEPTSHAIGIAEKGVFWTRVTAKGRNAHGSMPELGDNAADMLVRVLAELQRAKLAGAHPLLGAPTMNLGRLQAGEAVNQVPASAHAEIDFRYLPGASRAGITLFLEEVAARAGERVDVEVLSDHAPFEIARDHVLVTRAVDAVRRARGGIEPAVLGLPYGTEASKYAPSGIPSIILGPGEPGLAHTNRESILISALDEAEIAYASLLDVA